MSEVEEKNKALVRRYYEEVWSKGNVDTIDEFMAAHYVPHSLPTGLQPGPEGLRQMITTYRTAFPDLKATLEDIFAEGEMVALRWSVSGTHLGEWLDIPPTGNRARATGITVFRIAGGKVVESWTSTDLSPTEEELPWLTEVGGWPRRGDGPSTKRDTPQIQIWDGLTRSLTWRYRVDEARERERIEQELQVARQIQQELLPEATPKLESWEDGLVEAHSPQRQMFGFPHLRRLVSEHDAEEGSLVEFLMDELGSFVGEGWEQEDDITLLTLRRSVSPSWISWYSVRRKSNFGETPSTRSDE